MAWTLGLVLLTTYGGIRTWSAHASSEGVAALQQVRAEQAVANISRSREQGFDLPQPDTSTWSQNRVAAYEEGMRRHEVPEAVLRIPALKLTVPIYDGTSELNLNRGAGHIEGTTRIGEQGNVGVAGHRDGFFRSLNEIRIGEALYVDTLNETISYLVVGTKIVSPVDIGVLAVTETDAITLVTCYPFYFIGSAPKRFVVRARRVGPQSSQFLTAAPIGGR